MRQLNFRFGRSDGPLWPRIQSLYASQGLAWAIIGLGVVLRVAQYLYNRSLWADEAGLALNIVGRPFAGFLQPLSYGQAAPVGFLVLEGAIVQALGNSEYALRLLSLICGIASLFLFYGVAKRSLDRGALPLALVLFAVSDYLVFYSSELKQYSTDVAISLVVFLLAFDLRSRPWTARRMVLFGLVGGLAIWFSHSSAFVLAGAGLVLLLLSLVRRQWSDVGRLAIAGSLWSLSLVVDYFFVLRGTSSNEWLLGWWKANFMPLPPGSFADLKWFFDTFLEIFETPLGFNIAGVAVMAFLVGCYVMLVKDKGTLAILVAPAALALLASGLHLYPFYRRLLLFLIPSMLLLIAQGAAEIAGKTRNVSPVIGIVFMVLLLLYPARAAGVALKGPMNRAEIRPVMAYLQQHLLAEDVLYVHGDAINAFTYYGPRYGLNNTKPILGTREIGQWGAYVDELDRLRGSPRVWIVFSLHANYSSAEEKFILTHLDDIGTRLESFNALKAAVYLYDLSRPLGAKT